MTTVIDALVVTLGLDASGFARSQQQAQEGVGKFKQDTARSATEVERSAKRMQEAFGGVERAIMRLSTVFLGFAGGIGFVTFLANVQKSVAELYRLGQMLGQSGSEMQRWQQVGAQVGATADDITGSYKRLAQSINDWHLGLGAPNPVLRYLAGKGVNFTGPNGQVLGQTEIYKKLNEAIQQEPTQGRKEALLRNLGLGEGTVQMLMQSPEKLSADLAAAKPMSPQEMKEAAVAQAKLNAAWQETIRLATKLGNLVLPVFNSVMDSLHKTIQQDIEDVKKITEAFDRFDKWFSQTWIGRMAARILGEPVSKGNTPGTFDQRFGTWAPGSVGGRSGFRPAEGSNIGGGSTDTTNVPASMQGNDWLKQQREKNIAEINNNPELKAKVMRLLQDEEGGVKGRTGAMEALLNRTAMIQQRNPGHTIEKELRSGFYGPINRAGGYDRYRSGGLNSASQQQSATAFENAAGGSNLIAGRTDQGSSATNDPNARGPGRVSFLGMNPNSVFNFWKGSRAGSTFTHADSAAYADYINRGVAGSAGGPMWRGKEGVENWGNTLRAAPWLQPGGMSMINGIPTQTNNRSSTSETHIGQFTVMTEPRSNPWGIASQIKDAVQRSNIMDNSNSGPN